jgi:hypothetical protein
VPLRLVGSEMCIRDSGYIWSGKNQGEFRKAPFLGRLKFNISYT